MTPEAVQAVVAANTEGRFLGVFGEPRVNVLLVNLALDAAGAMMSLAIAATLLAAQDTTPKPAVTFGAFIDTYFAWDFGQPDAFDRPYTTQPARHDEFNVNLAFLEAKLTGEKVRGRVALQAGTSVQANYAGEPQRRERQRGRPARIIQEAWVGVRVSPKVWVDGGIYFSPIGWESFDLLGQPDLHPLPAGRLHPVLRDRRKVTWAGVAEGDRAAPRGERLAEHLREQPATSRSSPGWTGRPRRRWPWRTRFYAGNEQLDTLPARTRYYNQLLAKVAAGHGWDFWGTFDVGVQTVPDASSQTWYGAVRHRPEGALEEGGRGRPGGGALRPRSGVNLDGHSGWLPDDRRLDRCRRATRGVPEVADGTARLFARRIRSGRSQGAPTGSESGGFIVTSLSAPLLMQADIASLGSGMTDTRPDPDALLARVQQEESRSRRGRLKVFVGASPGVGKTFSMLEAARAARLGGRDVAGRAWWRPTAAARPPRLARGARRPAAAAFAAPRRHARGVRPRRRAGPPTGLILMDELAHTNAPGARHAQALAGRRRAARRRHRRLQHPQRPASREPERRRGADHGRHRPRDGAGRGARRGRRDRAGGRDARGARAAAPRGQGVPARSRRSARARPLLPRGQPASRSASWRCAAPPSGWTRRCAATCAAAGIRGDLGGGRAAAGVHRSPSERSLGWCGVRAAWPTGSARRGPRCTSNRRAAPRCPPGRPRGGARSAAARRGAGRHAPSR